MLARASEPSWCWRWSVGEVGCVAGIVGRLGSARRSVQSSRTDLAGARHPWRARALPSRPTLPRSFSR